MEPEIHSETLSEVYNALRVSRRCCVVQLLAESEDDVIAIRALAEQIAALEEGTSPETVSGAPYRNVYNALSQTHLSTLADADILIYDSDRQTIKPGPRFQLAVLCLSLNSAIHQTLQQ